MAYLATKYNKNNNIKFLSVILKMFSYDITRNLCIPQS